MPKAAACCYEKNADQLVPPSSLSKLMTTEVVLNEIKQGRLKLTDEFMVSENAWRKGGAPSHTSSMFVAIHSKVSVADLLHGVVIQSGNDACIVLAEGIAGSEEKFAEMMTARARELGLTKSTFGNSNGLPDPKQLMTARELAKLARQIIRTYPDHYSIYGETEFTWNKIRQLNRNPLLTMNIGADGLKTGFTKEGGYGLVGLGGAERDAVDRRRQRHQDRQGTRRRGQEAARMGFPQFSAGNAVRRRPADRRCQALWGRAWQRAADGGSGREPDGLAGGAEQDHSAGGLYRPGAGAGPEGQPIGTLKVWRGDDLVLEVPLQAAESVGTGNLSQRAFDAATELMIGLFRAGIQRL